jgi:cystathionine beta-lyase
VSDAARECGISLTSASKAFNLAGLKAALVVTASDRAQDVVRRMPFTADQVGLLGGLAAEAAFSSCDDWLDDVLRQLDRNRTVLDDLLPDAITWTPPQATYVAWLDCTATGLSDPAQFFLEKARVALSPGRTYDPAAVTHARLNFGTSEEGAALGGLWNMGRAGRSVDERPGGIVADPVVEGAFDNEHLFGTWLVDIDAFPARAGGHLEHVG